MPRKFEPVRWTIENAGREFGIDRKTLSSRLKQIGDSPGADDMWSTKQIVSAVCGDLESERIRKTRAEADQIEKQNRKMDREVIDVEEFRVWMGKINASAVQIILNSKLSDDEKDALRLCFSKLANAPEVVT